jgi:hypothetical protein
MSHQQYARQNHSTDIHNTFFESVAVIKYWENQNCMHEKIDIDIYVNCNWVDTWWQ